MHQSFFAVGVRQGQPALLDIPFLKLMRIRHWHHPQEIDLCVWRTSARRSTAKDVEENFLPRKRYENTVMYKNGREGETYNRSIASIEKGNLTTVCTRDFITKQTFKKKRLRFW